MLFNSFEFALFFLAVYGIYLLLPHRGQNRLLLAASYYFYGSWNVVLLGLIFASTIIDYICAIRIEESASPRRRKFFVTLSILANLGILGFFKYFNFFAASLRALGAAVGITLDPVYLDILLPVGISFYTFQTMSYTIDVYRGSLRAERNMMDFALYVAFFPQLVAGPIERASRLLPQIVQPRVITWERIHAGCFLIFWGLFEKVFVADNLAAIADPVFAGRAPYEGSAVLMAVYAFTIQIFCDFAGYSDIARGLARCMGFELMLNFNLPYFATNPRDLWKRWHISLSTWIRDYLFKPLGGYGRSRWLSVRNVIITFTLAGLWHGANWTFVLWGLYHGILLAFYAVLQPVLSRIPEPRARWAARGWYAVRIVFFFHLFCVGALIFRAPSIAQAWAMGQALWGAFHPQADLVWAQVRAFLFYSGALLAVQYWQFQARDLDVVARWPVPVRAVFYGVIFYLIMLFGMQGGQQFYYFQF